MKSVWSYTFGAPETLTPTKIFKDKIDKIREADLPIVLDSPITMEMMNFTITTRGCLLELPFEDQEQFYGLGLQLKSFNQNYKKKTLRVNSDPVADTGDSHAPVPFYVSTKGYGVFIDTARYASFYFGTHFKQETEGIQSTSEINDNKSTIADNVEDLYSARKTKTKKTVVIETPSAKGITVYIFGGPTLLDAVCRYNIFSGGGVTPPMWGLGIWYRTYVYSDKKAVLKQITDFRNENVPCDVFGFEPGWQTHAYSCSYIWDENKFPNKDEMIDEINSQGFHINLWEHLFIHQTSPIYEVMKNLSSDYKVWDGLIPDFSIKEAVGIFAQYHKKEFIDKGISGFKFDECDNSDFISSPWSYPEHASFPSGMDGEQMHSLMGLLYQEMIMPVFAEKNQRTYGGVRSTHAFSSDMPFVLYSDLYDHKDFVRGLVNSGFSGLLWTPEVRQCNSVEELIRRIQSVIFSPMALINAWMIPNPPWKQFDETLNKEGVFLSNYKEVEAICRDLFQLRMSLIPYLYSSFFEYETKGIPPFRALIMDYPDDSNTYVIDDQFMIGNDILFAAMFEGETSRNVYLPKGNWFDYFTKEKYAGNLSHKIDCPLENMLLFVKENSLIPIAKNLDYIPKDKPINVRFEKYGKGIARTILIEDDGESFDYKSGKYNTITVTNNENNNVSFDKSGNYEKTRYDFT